LGAGFKAGTVKYQIYHDSKLSKIIGAFLSLRVISWSRKSIPGSNVHGL
jgi:hypothetical protein